VTSRAHRPGLNLLVVCTGNICRSAAADRLLSAWSLRRGQPVAVRSAGTHARSGRPIHPLTEQALQRYRVPADGFTSRRLDQDDVDWADLVLTMTAEHRDAVVALNPRGMAKVFTLLEAAALSDALRRDEVPVDGRAPVAEVLRSARTRYRRRRGPDVDIVDPIEGSAQLHADVVAQVVDAVELLIPLLWTGPVPDETVRMPRLPAVPRSGRRPGP
jgi:protein-tyrosine phosphatase